MIYVQCDYLINIELLINCKKSGGHRTASLRFTTVQVRKKTKLKHCIYIYTSNCAYSNLIKHAYVVIYACSNI